MVPSDKDKRVRKYIKLLLKALLDAQAYDINVKRPNFEDAVDFFASKDVTLYNEKLKEKLDSVKASYGAEKSGQESSGKSRYDKMLDYLSQIKQESDQKIYEETILSDMLKISKKETETKKHKKEKDEK